MRRVLLIVAVALMFTVGFGALNSAARLKPAETESRQGGLRHGLRTGVESLLETRAVVERIFLSVDSVGNNGV